MERRNELQWKKICGIMLFSFVLLFACTSRANAKNYTLKENVLKSATLTDRIDCYTITIPSAGWVKAELFNQSLNSNTVYLTVCNESISDSLASAQACTNRGSSTTIGLEKGTYVITVRSDYYSGNYQIRYQFTAAKNNETEPNNDLLSAMPLKANTNVTGFLSAQDRKDVYKITVPSRQKINITAVSSADRFYMVLRDQNYAQIKQYYFNQGKVDNYSDTVNAGTYYIEFISTPNGSYSGTGKYIVFWTGASTSTSNPNASIKNVVPKLSSVVNKNGAQTVTWEKVSGADSYSVYCKINNGLWEKLGSTKGLSYTNKKVSSGKTYIYTVKAVKSGISSNYNSKGISKKYLSAPKLVSVVNKRPYQIITWKKVTGASQYRVYVKQNGTWKYIATTKNCTYKYSGVKSNNTYTYTVVAQNGSYKSAYNSGISKKY